ncbi:hypothetical protein Strvi_0174 (plasmid) [Streptomyces violaceusniger Tu 4113]|uniref:Uncharacterized protein n=1 Tax=Streptomyces violaceusniger (strain Tu 4113) TaxID=653045 RepID=G2PHZ6_STRV4|nr:hypothetical protein Strvi_0174 [Streptomyces violaceusniger Tu 4113]
MSLIEAVPYLIGNLPLTDLTRPQLNGVACVYCAGVEALAYAGWLRSPLSPGRYLSAPVSACARCRASRLDPAQLGSS